MRLQRFVRTPKGVTLLALLTLAVVAVLLGHDQRAGSVLAVAAITAGAIDVVVLRVRRKRWHFPDGAIISGLIVGMILTPVTSFSVVAATAAIAVVSKYVARTHTANVFNPAALALLISFFAFHTGQDWWGALPEAGPVALAVLFATGVFVLQRVNKLSAALSFLGVYYLLITVTTLVGDTAGMAELYRTPDIQAALFFAFFMVSDPPTCPPSSRDQLVYGCIVGAVAFAAFQWIGAVYWLIAGLMAGNIWEAARRIRERLKRAAIRSSVAATT